MINIDHSKITETFILVKNIKVDKAISQKVIKLIMIFIFQYVQDRTIVITIEKGFEKFGVTIYLSWGFFPNFYYIQ